MTSDQVRFLGAIGADPGVIVVVRIHPIKTLMSYWMTLLLTLLNIFSGGSAAGGFDHLKVLMALKRKGFTDIKKVKYIGLMATLTL